jgi:hypothetical protein
MTSAPGDDDLVPVSVRLGQVVPPDDPEDWTRPLTWVAAAGMLGAPLLAFAWFVAAPPADGVGATPMTYGVAAVLGAGAAATAATQQGTVRAWTATLGAGLFGALALIVVGVVSAGERQVGAASPTLAHAFAAAIGGLIGAVAASPVAAVTANRWGRRARFAAALVAAVIGAVVGVAWLMPPDGG